MIIVTTLVIPPGGDVGPFNLYSDSDGYTVPFATNVSATALQAGYSSTVPNDATIIRVISNGLCTNFIDLNINLITTTTTSSSSTSTTSTTSTSTSTSTSSSTTTTTTIACPNCTPQDVTIGSQIWTGCNLDVTTYRDGTPIPEVTDPTAWAALTTGAWCYYANTSSNGTTYGKLYNWYAVNDSRGLAPSGYHIPTDAEWTTLTDYLGGLTIAGGPLKETGLCNWEIPNTDATNSSGFSGIPGGFRSSSGSFSLIGRDNYFWSSSLNFIPPFNNSNAWYRLLLYNHGYAVRSYQTKRFGFSIRLIKD